MPRIQVLDEQSSRKLIRAGWDDVPHLDPTAKAELLAETPPWLRDARSKGIPNIGIGAIYTVPREKIEYHPFSIPDHWPRFYAMDVGWNWTAALWFAYDRESATNYIYDAYKAGEELPQIHADAVKVRGAWIPGLIDPSANNRAQRDGERLMEEYTSLGLDLTKANNAVEAGIIACWRDLSIGRTRVASHLEAFWHEYRLYHRDERGQIVKKNDHLLDCMRYGHNSGHLVRKVKPAELMAGIAATHRPHGAGGY